jgi:hypothetical protein
MRRLRQSLRFFSQQGRLSTVQQQFRRVQVGMAVVIEGHVGSVIAILELILSSKVQIEGFPLQRWMRPPGG